MPESLLSPSRVLLFGRKMDDLQVAQAIPDKTVQLATTRSIATTGIVKLDGRKSATGDRILVKNPPNDPGNGIYIADDAAAWTNPAGQQPSDGQTVYVEDGTKNGGSLWVKDGNRYKRASHGKTRRLGGNRQLDEQLEDSCFARIYGFSYDGTYYDLPRPALFLVHGDGEPTSVSSQITSTGPAQAKTDAQLARAPQEPSVTGIAAADFQFADDISMWSYDKADFTIRMDVESGMFEQVLLDMYFDGGGGVSGARVSGARVSGARVSGARVSGARVSGARVGGPRGDGGD